MDDDTWKEYEAKEDSKLAIGWKLSIILYKSFVENFHLMFHYYASEEMLLFCCDSLCLDGKKGDVSKLNMITQQEGGRSRIWSWFPVIAFCILFENGEKLGMLKYSLDGET